MIYNTLIHGCTNPPASAVEYLNVLHLSEDNKNDMFLICKGHSQQGHSYVNKMNSPWNGLLPLSRRSCRTASPAIGVILAFPKVVRKYGIYASNNHFNEKMMSIFRFRGTEFLVKPKSVFKSLRNSSFVQNREGLKKLHGLQTKHATMHYSRKATKYDKIMYNFLQGC